MGKTLRAVDPRTWLVCLLAVALTGCSSTTTGEMGMAPAVGSPPSGYAASGEIDGLKLVADLPLPAETNGGVEVPIAIGDVLEISVFQIKDLSRPVEVDTNGRINLPLVGTVEAAGKPVRQLERDIERAYSANYLQNPQVTIFLKNAASQRVTVDGAVKRPGVAKLPPNATLIDAIALTAGLTPVADPSKIFVFRKVGQQQLVARYDVQQIRAGRRPSPRILGGDVVVVFSSARKAAIANLKEALGVANTGNYLRSVAE